MSFGVRTYEKGMRKGVRMRKRKEKGKIEDKIRTNCTCKRAKIIEKRYIKGEHGISWEGEK
jgi:hypothetical protein